MIRFVSLFLILIASLFSTTLTGTLNGPDGTGFTGTLFMTLSQQAALSASGGCGGPALIIPTQIKITVTSGSLVSPPTLAGNDCLLPQGTYYNITMRDTSGNILFTDKWLIQGSTQNLGTIVSVVISGTTQTLGGVGVVLTQPTGAQTGTQPGATYLNWNNLNVTNGFVLPDTSFCNTAQCQFNTTVSLTKGLNTGLTQPSVLWIGNTSAANFYNRTFTGADAVCTAVLDGWTGIRTDTKEIQVCIGGVMKKVALQ